MSRFLISVIIISSLLHAANCSSILEPRQLEETNIFTPEEATLLGFYNASAPPKSQKCKNFPGDADWPSDDKWALLNKTTNGALIKTIPLAAPCYPGPLADADKCAYITAQWSNSSLQ